MTGCRKKIGQAARHHFMDFGSARQRRNIRSVIDNGIVGEEGQYGVVLCPIEMIAIGVDDTRDVGLVDQPLKASCVVWFGAVIIHGADYKGHAHPQQASGI